STTTKTYVSGLIAEGRQGDLVPTIRKLILMNLTGIGLLTHGLILYPEFIAGLFTENAETIQLTVRSAWVVFPAVLVFGCTSILLGTVEGSGNTMAGFVIELITTLFYLAAAYFFAIERRDPVYLVWTAEYVYVVLIGVLSLLYLRNGKWKSTEV
ncbi:MAG: MATE family efflux transporter, partial [Bacteroidota bacterium]